MAIIHVTIRAKSSILDIVFLRKRFECLNNRADPFRYIPEDSAAGTTPQDRSKEALKWIQKWKLDALIVVGGDGTLSIAQRFFELGVPVVAVPKTIDNDLNATDVTFGFDSALVTATEAVDKLHTTAESHHRAMILEVMGRYAGWIALRSGMAGGGDVILIPEIPYDVSVLCQAIQTRKKRGKHFSILVVAEGARSADGEMTVRETIPGSPDPVRLGGVGHEVARQIQLCSSVESRVTVLGHLQRGGTPTPFDRWLATRFGAEAVRLVHEGRMGQMVALKGRNIEPVPIREAVVELRRVPVDSEEIRTARAVGTSFGDVVIC